MICSSQDVDLYLNMVVMKDVLSFSVITFQSACSGLLG